MSLRFILGRSGSGKTYYCLESVRAELRSAGRGCRLILLVPEQATFQVEQALLSEDDELRGYHRVEVMSFARLARLVLAETSPGKLKPLSEFGKQMILGRLMQQLHGDLKIFNRTADRSGFAIELSSVISELRQYQKSPSMLLKERDDLLRSADPAVMPLADKLADLALILQAYQDYIDGEFIDPDDYLDMISERCGRVSQLQGCCLWVDGFAGFTPQQYSALRALFKAADRTYFTLCLDAKSKEFQRAHDPANQPDQMDLFHPTLETYQRLNTIIATEGIELEEPLILPFDKTMPRFKNSKQLARLENNLFADKRPVHLTEAKTQDIIILESPNRRSEVDAVARQILKLCREHGYRFRDITVILRDFADYQELLEAALSDYNIPYFIDLRRGVAHHPLIELISSALRVLLSDFKSEYVFDYLKTDFVPVSRELVDTLENYCIAHGIQNTQWTEARPWRFGKHTVESVERIDKCRRAVAAPLLQMIDRLSGDQLPVKDIIASMIQFLDRLQVQRTLCQWYRQAQSRGDLDAAQVHQQVYSDLIDLFDDMADAIGDIELSLGQFSEILTSALEQMTLRLVPPAMDQVLIGTIERSRQPNIRAAFILGVNQGRFPRVSAPEVFFTDAQRDRLGENNFELAPTSSEKLLHERYLAYIALTRGRDFLWVSYPIADAKGTALNPSSLIDSICQATGDITITPDSCDQGQPKISGITNPQQLGRQLAVALSVVRTGKNPPAVWQELYHAACLRPDWSNTLDRSLAGVTWRNTAKLDKSITDKLFSRNLIGSVSRLESFAACPFQHFARYSLGLRDRDELKLGALNMGSFYHKALYEIFSEMQQQGLNWHKTDDDNIDAIVKTASERLIKKDYQLAELLGQSCRNRFLLNDAVTRLGRFCYALRQAAAAGDFQQCAAELEFGPGKTIKPLELKLANGRQLTLGGIIDRVDTCLTKDGSLALLVFDYKSSGRSFPFARFYHGLSLQLISYLLVLQENYPCDNQLGKVPAAALYLPIQQKGKSQQGPPPPDVLTNQQVRGVIPHKASGIINSDCVYNLENKTGQTGWSKYYSMHIKKDGTVTRSNNNSVVGPDDMSAIFEHCTDLLKTLANDILDGQISIAPYRLGEKDTPCSRCDYNSLCRFDFNCDNYRQLSGYDKQTILERIKK